MQENAQVAPVVAQWTWIQSLLGNSHFIQAKSQLWASPLLAAMPP